MARIKDASVEAVKAAADIVALVEDVRPPAQGRRHATRASARSTRSARRASRSRPARGTFNCFGCGEGGDAITFVAKTEQLDFVGAIEWLARALRRRARVRGDRRPSATQARAARAAAARCSSRRPRFYERCLWDSDAGRARARVPRSRAASARRSAASSGSASRPAAPTLARKARGEGLHARRAARGRAREPARQRLLPAPARSSRSPTRAARVRGFQARKLHDDDPLQAKYVNSPEGELFRKGDLLYGLDLARAAIAKQDRAVVVEGNTDVIALRQAGLRAGRRVDGHGAHRARS